jgi:hypothetical protein
MKHAFSKGWRSLSFSAALAALCTGACTSEGPVKETDEGDGPSAEPVAEAQQAIPITRVVPIRFIEAMSCQPGSSGCSTNTTPDVLRASVDRANVVFQDIGIKFWIKSVERYQLPKFATKNNDSYTWASVKNGTSGTTEDGLRSVFPSMTSTSYNDSADVKSTADWMSSATAFFGDPDEIAIWLVNPGTAGAQSYGQFPEHARHVVIVASNLDATDGTTSWATTHLAHEIGHFFGVRHPEAGPAGTNPLTGIDWDSSDQWDLVFCKANGGTPTRFFTSKSDFANFGCSSANVGRILQTNNCASADPFGIVSCTVDGHSYSSGDSQVDEVLWVDSTVVQNPPTSIKYGTNVMSYYSYYPVSGGGGRDTRSPSRFSSSQLAQISVYKDNNQLYTSADQAALLRSDSNVPGGGLATGLSSLRASLGTASEDLLWWSNGDLTFKNQTKPISGTNFTPVAGDFDNNGFDDIAWYDPSAGTINFWWSNGDKTFTSQNNVSVGTGFQLFSGNFDAANGDDLFFYAPGAGADKILWANGSARTFTTQAVSVSGTYTPVAGNFDGQGGDDIFWYSSSAGTANVWWAVGSTKTFTSQNNVSVGTGLTPIAGNFDGLVGTDLFWYGPGATADQIWFANDDKTFDKRSASVSGTYLPIAGDFDGDGADDIFWDAVGATTDYIWRAQWNRNTPFDTTGRASVYGTFKPVAGKFDGVWQGKNATDIFWYRQ